MMMGASKHLLRLSRMPWEAPGYVYKFYFVQQPKHLWACIWLFVSGAIVSSSRCVRQEGRLDRASLLGSGEA